MAKEQITLTITASDFQLCNYLSYGNFCESLISHSMDSQVGTTMLFTNTSYSTESFDLLTLKKNDWQKDQMLYFNVTKTFSTLGKKMKI